MDTEHVVVGFNMFFKRKNSGCAKNLRWLKKLCFLILVGCAAQGDLGAATYYVAKTGSDVNDGSQARPWLTIQKAANTVVAGDTVEVGAGDYREIVNLARDASTTQPITFRANGAEVSGFNCRKSDYVIEGFRINGRTQRAIALVYTYPNVHRVKLLSNILQDTTNQYAVYLDRGDDPNPANSSSFNVISNNTFVNINYIITTCFGRSNQFLRNTFKDCNGQADIFRLFGEGHVAADNLITNISTIIENHTDFFQVFGPEYTSAPSEYNYVRNVVLERNLVINSQLQICQLETFNNPPGYMTNLIFRNNLFVNTPYGANVDMDGTKWHNNLFYRVNYQNGGHCFAFGGAKGSAYGTEIKNNIFYSCGNGQDWVGWYPVVGDFGINNFNISADYNFVCGPNFAPKRTAPQYANGWGAQGQESHGLNGGDPRFVATERFDFRLVSGSRLIGAGVRLPGFSDDFNRAIRPSTGWDIGAFQNAPLSRPAPPINVRIVANP